MSYKEICKQMIEAASTVLIEEVKKDQIFSAEYNLAKLMITSNLNYLEYLCEEEKDK